jgi:hypothetical protein
MTKLALDTTPRHGLDGGQVSSSLNMDKKVSTGVSIGMAGPIR